MARALEFHVLDEVRQPALIVVFEHRARLDDQPELRATRGLRVRPHVVAQPVRQRADDDLRIDRHRLRQAVCGDGFRRRLAAGGRCLREDESGKREQGGSNDAGGGAVLHRAAGIEEFSLAEDLAAGLLGELREPDERRVADGAGEPFARLHAPDCSYSKVQRYTASTPGR